MQRRSFLGVCLSSSLIGAFGAVQTALAKPKKVDPDGWLWGYVATCGDHEESGTFRVRNLEVFKDDKLVGKIEPQGGHELGDRTVLILTKFGKANGKILLEKTHKDPPVWKGTLNAKDGTVWEFKVKRLDK